MDTVIVLFTRDLRVSDHPALRAATAEAEQVVPAFVLDEKLLAGRCGAPNRLSFLAESLRDLDESLRSRGARLIVRRGDPGVTVVRPGQLLPAGGDHYRVFTPYWRAWRGAERRAPLRAPRRLSTPARADRQPGSDLRRLAGPPDSRNLPEGGETAGRARLERWLRRGPRAYEDRADALAADATSRLSSYLHFGCLSASELLARAEDRWGGEAVARQLCWRDFHHQVLAARPDLPRVDYRRPRRWRRDERLLHLRRWFRQSAALAWSFIRDTSLRLGGWTPPAFKGARMKQRAQGLHLGCRR